ncbi:MAG: InlB B-repeat-containing protein [Acutalibacteraceae bacterium]
MKKQFKKGISLIMTVFMLLSCWVFVAPTQADAVNSGSYSYELWIDSDNDTGGWNSAAWTLTGTNNNGKGSTTTLGTSTQQVNMDNDHYTILSGTSTYFPTKLVFSWSFGGGLLTWRDMYVTIHISVNGTDLPLTLTKNSSTGTCEISGQYIHSASASTTKGSGTVTCTVNSSAYPKANSVVFDAAPGAVTVPKTGTATTSMQTHLNDQYGVRVASAASTYSKSTSLSSNRSSTTGITCAAGTTTTSYDPWTISVTNSAKLTGYDTNTITATVSYTFNGVTKTATKTFVVTDPKYTFSFNVNGGTSISPNASVTKYYYNKLTSAEIPSSGVRAGYEFIAMYGDAKSPNYDFTKPTPGTTSGYTGQLTNTTPIEGDKTWYAAWWAKNLTATFIDNENNVVATVQGKVDKTITEVNGAAVSAIEAPEYHKRPGDTGTYDYVFSGWVVDSAVDTSGNDYYGTIGALTPDEAVLKGDVTFRATYSVVKNSYNVKFYDVNGNLTDADYSYNDLPTQPGDQVLAANNTYTYLFKGWTKVSDGRTDYYLVDATGYDDDGNYIPVTTDFTVRTDAVYVPVFEKVYKEYTVSFSYDGVANKTVLTKLHYNDTYEVPVPATSYTKDGYRYTYNGWTLNGNPATPGTVKGNAAYVADYAITPAVYTIRFFDYDGTQINDQDDQYNHGDAIRVTNADATQIYRDDFYEYTFKNFERFNGDAFVNGSIAVMDEDYYAVYDKAELMTVNYYNGDELLETAKEVAGRAVPAYTGDTPTKADDLYATNYVFAGWRDKDGNEVTTMPAGGVDLYAHYTADVTNYSVRFLKDDGTDMIPEQILHYGDAVTVPTEEQRAKTPDNTYSYEFKAWDNDVATVCGGDAVYKATYRKSYNYYTVTWLDENGDVFKQEDYIYNERINAPLTQPETSQTPTQGENYEMVFNGWQKDDGTYYKRGDRITGPATYTATYAETGKICNVTFLDDDGSTLQEIKVAYGTALSDIAYATPIKTSTDDVHYIFAGWEGTDSSTTVTDKDTIYVAAYRAEAHCFEIDVVKTEPTFFEEGVGTEKCSCGLTREVAIEKLTDTVAPKSKLYVKNATWVTGDSADFTNAVPAAPSNQLIINATDTGDVNAQFNKDGSKGSGVGKIEYSVQYGQVDPASIADDQWTVKFDYDATKEYLTQQAETEAAGDPVILKEKLAEVDAYMAALKANASGTLGNIATYADGTELANDCEFVLYGKITDRLGNVSYINSGLLVYDTTAPEVSVDSDHHYNNKHCVEATITASDNRAIESVTLNGEAIELVDGQYTVTEAGIYQVVVIDTAGNESKANFEIVGKHAIKAYTIPATCTEDGYQYEKCLLCQQQIGERIGIEAMGHEMDSGVYTKPTCEANGYTTYTCKMCGYKETVEDDPSTKGAHDWVLTQQVDSTCSATGYKTYTCSICSKTETVTDEINPDAHKFYYPVTVKATCTEDGSITRECKYCGYKDIETIAKTGHTASGVWVVTQPATCLEDGLQVQYCANCDTTEVQAQETIPATGHSYKVKEVVEPTETEQGYTIYECRICDETTEGHFKYGDYVDPAVTYTVTFVVEGTETQVKKVEGETVIATEAPATVKEANETYKYTFSHWEDESGNTVTLPLEVTANTTLTAVFNSRYVNYAVTLVRENTDGTTTQIQKIGYLHNGQVLDLPEAPEKKSDSTYDYSYVGWKLKGTADDTASKTWTIAASDAILVPVYEATLREYTVVFAYDADNVLQTLTVKAGDDAVYTGETPVKAYDTKYHYVFAGWSDSIEKIQAPTYVTPKFTAVEHTKIAIASTSADCENPGTTTYKCADCDYEVTENTTPALGHIWSAPYVDEDGNSVKKCERCDKVVEDDTMYIVKFLNDDGSIIKTIGYLKYGADISDKIPTATKEETASVSYEFAGWTPEVATTVTGDATYTATYTEKAKYYNVIYAIDSANVLQIFRDVQGGSPVPAYTGAEPTKADTDAYGHYVFDGWSRNDETVTETLYITAKFKKVEHSYVDETVEATCETGSGIKHTCSVCGYTYTEETGKALGHKWILIEAVEPTFDNPGYEKYVCERCGETMTKDYAQKEMISVVITVLDSDGHGVPDVRASLYDNGTFVTSGTTGADGKVVLKVPEAKEYTLVLDGEGFNTKTITIKINEDGSYDTSKIPTIDVVKCSCPCHRSDFWGAIFRFFHKIVKMFTGEFKCCNNPDPRYYK